MVDTGWTESGHRVDTCGKRVDTVWTERGHMVDRGRTQGGQRVDTW